MHILKQLYFDLFKDKFANVVSGIVAVLGLIATKLWGGWNTAMETLLIFMILDFVMGVMGGQARKELSSTAMFEGAIKKIFIWILIAASYRVDVAINAEESLKTAITIFFISHEGLSIIENAAVLGIPIPQFLEESLIQLQKGNKKDLGKTDRE